MHYHQQLLSVFVTGPCMNRIDDTLLSATVNSIRHRAMYEPYWWYTIISNCYQYSSPGHVWTVPMMHYCRQLSSVFVNVCVQWTVLTLPYCQQLLSVFVPGPCTNRIDDALLSATVMSCIRHRACTMNRIADTILSRRSSFMGTWKRIWFALWLAIWTDIVNHVCALCTIAVVIIVLPLSLPFLIQLLLLLRIPKHLFCRESA